MPCLVLWQAGACRHLPRTLSAFTPLAATRKPSISRRSPLLDRLCWRLHVARRHVDRGALDEDGVVAAEQRLMQPAALRHLPLVPLLVVLNAACFLAWRVAA